MRWKNCVLLPPAGWRTQFFHLILTQLMVSNIFGSSRAVHESVDISSGGALFVVWFYTLKHVSPAALQWVTAIAARASVRRINFILPAQISSWLKLRVRDGCRRAWEGKFYSIGLNTFQVPSWCFLVLPSVIDVWEGMMAIYSCPLLIYDWNAIYCIFYCHHILSKDIVLL